MSEHDRMESLKAIGLDALPHAALIAGIDGTILARNAAAEARLPRGSDISEILSPVEHSPLSWDEDVALLREVPNGVTHRNVPLAGAGRRRLLADVRLRRLTPVAGRADGDAVLVLVEDVSGRVSMERRVAAGERLAATGELAARIAHELNNPLDAVMRYLSIARRNCDNTACEPIEKARAGLVRMTEVIRTMLDETGARHAGRRRQTIRRLLDEALEVMAPRAEALGVSYVCDLAPVADRPADTSVFQVLCNVTRNALDAMPEGGVLNVSARRGDRTCEIEFADTGHGLKHGRTEDLFEPFVTTKPHGEGFGLGLAICREILARLGGAIAARPRTGGGAVVTVSLPIEPAPGEDEKETPS